MITGYSLWPIVYIVGFMFMIHTTTYAKAVTVSSSLSTVLHTVASSHATSGALPQLTSLIQQLGSTSMVDETVLKQALEEVLNVLTTNPSLGIMSVAECTEIIIQALLSIELGSTTVTTTVTTVT